MVRSIIYLSLLLFLPSCTPKAAVSQPSDYFNPFSEHLSLYDYSLMGDTTIVEMGYLTIGTTTFTPDPEPGIYFAKRTFVVRNGQLRKVVVFDTNTGCRQAFRYRPDGTIRSTDFECRNEWATNAPHFIQGEW